MRRSTVVAVSTLVLGLACGEVSDPLTAPGPNGRALSEALGSHGGGPAGVIAFSAGTSVLRVPEDHATIQAAVDAAEPGDVIQVAPGTYNEKVVIQTSGIRLQGKRGPDGARAVLDGTGFLGIGLHVLGAAGATVQDVQIMGFVVENFERGIVLENVERSRVHLNEVRLNLDKPPLTLPVPFADGIVLISSHSNEVSQNFTHDNGHDGILLTGGSSGNTIRGNRSHRNGSQTGAGQFGCGIALVGAVANRHNLVVENEVLDNGWGILVLGAGASVGNEIKQNRIHGGARAGVAVRGPSKGNFVEQNDATGNGLANLAPSGRFDLFDSEIPPDNVWERNKGTSNF